MAKIKRCVICDEKLYGTRCRLCGLDHTRMMKTEYRLNTSRPYSTHKINTQQRGTSQRNSVQSTTQQQNTTRIEYNRKQTAAKTTSTAADLKQKYNNTAYNRSKTVKGKVEKEKSGWIKLLPIIIVAVLGLIGYADEVLEDNSYDTYIEENQYDPFENAEYELSYVGDSFETQLTAGEYIVGVHLPEGYYDIEILEGEGYLNINDSVNGIYDWNRLSYENNEDAITGLEEYPLYQGTMVTIENSALLQFKTENGQLDIMNNIENPLLGDAIIRLESEEVYTVGKDIPEGVYDVELIDAWGASLYCGMPYEDDLDNEENDYNIGNIYRSLWLDTEENGAGTYKNLVLNEGMNICAEMFEDGYVILTQSKIISPVGYDAYYDLYW